MVGMLQIEESRIKWQGGVGQGKRKIWFKENTMTPFFLRPLQPLSISLCFLSTFHSILYHSTLFKHLEQAKNSEKNKQGIFCFSSYSEYYFNKNGNNNQAEEVYLYSCKCTTTMKV